MSKKMVILSVLAMLSCYGCSDDSSGSSGGTNTGCLSNTECDSGVCLNSGKCAVVVGLGDSCDDAHICADGLECKSETCSKKETPVTSDECTKNDDCPDGKVCKNGKCKEDTIIETPECTSNDDCTDGKICKDGECKADDVPSQVVGCQTDEDCAGNEINKNCTSDNVCGHYVELGDLCGDDAYCPEGLECDVVCYEKLGEGAECDESDELHVCDDNSICIVWTAFVRQYRTMSPPGTNVMKIISSVPKDLSVPTGHVSTFGPRTRAATNPTI